MLKEKQNYIMNFLYTLILSFCFSYIFLSFLKIPFVLTQMIIVISLTSLFSVVTRKIKLMPFIFIGAMAIITAVISVLNKNFISFSAEFINNIITLKGSTVSFENTIWALGFCILTCYIFSLFILRAKLYIIPHFIVLLTFIVINFQTDNISSTVFLIFIALTILCLALITSSSFLKNHKGVAPINGYKIVLYLSPFLLVVFAIILFLPKPHLPIKMPIIDELTKSVIFDPEKKDAPSESVFGLDTNKLDTKPKLTNTVVLRAWSPVSYYLRAYVKDSYNLDRWENTSKIGENDYENQMANIEKNNAYKYLNVGDDNYVRSFENEITLVNIESNQLYSSTILSNLQTSIKPKFSNNGELIFSQEPPAKYTYSYTATVPIYGGDTFKNLLKSSYPDIYEKKNKKVSEIETALITRKKSINDKYLQLKNITPETYALAKEITKDATTSYDKAKAIEKHLSENYKYSLDVTPLPSGKDFVDNFLFNTKSGYCTSFATSMVILARISKIPARYVEGYAMPAYTDADGQYLVTGLNAHAWPELYFEGFGWVAFEPTPTLTKSFYENSIRSSATSENNSSSSEDISSSSEPPIPSSSSSSLAPESSSSETKENEKTFNILDYLIYFFIIIAVIILAVLIILILKYRSKRAEKKLAKAILFKDNRVVAIKLSEQYFNIIAKTTNLKIRPTITLNEYLLELLEFDDFYKTSHFNEIIDIYLKATCSNLEITNEEIYKLQNYFPVLREHLTHTLSKIKLLTAKYIKGII